MLYQAVIADHETVKDVHKAPPLDLVAIFTLAPPSGPLPDHVPILQQLQHSYNDSLMLLLFHPQTILDGTLTGGKLPISIYESYYEPGSESADKGLQVDGWAMGRQLQMRFRQLPFEVETGEAEMIAVDFVAKGSGSAAAHNSAAPPSKAKGRAEDNAASNDVQLSAADEEGRQDRTYATSKSHELMFPSHLVSHRQVQRHQDAAPTHQPHQGLPRRTTTIIPHRRLHLRRPKRPSPQPPTPPRNLFHALSPTFTRPSHHSILNHNPRARNASIRPRNSLRTGTVRRAHGVITRLSHPHSRSSQGYGLQVFDCAKGKDGQESCWYDEGQWRRLWQLWPWSC